jgi:NAD(P)-dependent dehydrogenase (short-subunit alcohol dehydrogenase family)
LLARGATVHALVREGSRERLAAVVRDRWHAPPASVVPVIGDISQAGCGLAPDVAGRLVGHVDHFFHLAALYDMTAGKDDNIAANVEGTRNAVALANRLGAPLCFHHVSSIAVAGDYAGTFREDRFDEGQKHRHPYFATKFAAEAIVRREATVPFRIYRPGIVIGSSETGEADRIDGPYHAFKLIQRLRDALPRWFPLIALEGGAVPLVPVDFVADAIAAIAHAPGLDGRAFHIVDPKPLSLGATMATFCRAAHAPEPAARLDRKLFSFIPDGLVAMAQSLPAVRAFKREVATTLGIPVGVLDFILWGTTFDARDATAVLSKAGIACPPLDAYAWKIWDHWERHLDPDLNRARTLADAVKGKVVVVTGASSGIGRAVAQKVAAAGATALLVARSAENLDALKREIEAAGGHAVAYPCSLTDGVACDALVSRILAEHRHVDVLINNAGKSIRRSVAASDGRFHDFERTMSLNYFGALRLILGLLPSMRERKSGHIINVSSIGVQTNAPRFSAYVASKAALDAFSRAAASEVKGDGVDFSTVYMPLVRTPMISPTKIYDQFPALSPDDAADLIARAVITRTKRFATRLGTFGEIAYALAPRLSDAVLNMGYRLFPDSVSRDAPGEAEAKPQSPESLIFAHILKGIHW